MNGAQYGSTEAQNLFGVSFFIKYNDVVIYYNYNDENDDDVDDDDDDDDADDADDGDVLMC